MVADKTSNKTQHNPILITHKSISQYRKPAQPMKYCKYAVTIMSAFRNLKPASTGIISLLLFCIRHRKREVEGRVCVLHSILLKENAMRCSQEVNLHGARSDPFQHPSLHRTIAAENSDKQHCNNKSDSFITFQSTVSVMVYLTTTS